MGNLYTITNIKGLFSIRSQTATFSSFKLRSKFIFGALLLNIDDTVIFDNFFSFQYIDCVYVMIIDMQYSRKLFEIYTNILNMNWSSAIHFQLNLSRNDFPICHCVIFSVNIYQRKAIFGCVNCLDGNSLPWNQYLQTQEA